MTTKKELLTMFEELEKIEENAMDLYTDFISKWSDIELVEVTKKIRNQEAFHVDLVREAIELLK
jgi:rubrerythrin